MKDRKIIDRNTQSGAEVNFKLNKLSYAVSAALAATAALGVPVLHAQEQDQEQDQDKQQENQQPQQQDKQGKRTDAIDELVVTASRREATVQDIPYNISAISGEELENQRITDLTEFVRAVPGLYMPDNGVRGPSQLIIRGLNVDASRASEGITPASTVSVYIGETPLYVDLKMVDMNRIEVLRGPQGTLYGSGSLAGTIRYIPNKPVIGETELKFSSKAYSTDESSGLSTDINLVANYPAGDRAALRFVYSTLDEKGFIDSPYLVSQPGVSNPQDLNDLVRENDVNNEETSMMRLSFLWSASDSVELNASYIQQEKLGGARQVSHFRSATFPTGRYESAERYLEPNDSETTLFNIEVTSQLDFADLIFIHSSSEFNEVGQRDQTDLLLRFEYGYEDFPGFSSFTREVDFEETTTTEIRIVSNNEDSKFNWIAGYFSFEEDGLGSSREFTPGIPQFWAINRPDNLEYIQLTEDHVKETAFYGEVGYQITDKWQVTLGLRQFEFEDKIRSAFGLPLLDPTLPHSDDLTFDDLGVSIGDTKRDDTFYKFNTSYDVNDDLMLYFTRSEGFRRGGANTVRPCDAQDLANPGQSLCALPNELFYDPDTAINYEIGMHSTWNDRRMTFNGAFFVIDWQGVQVGGATTNGAIPITENGNNAESTGVELDIESLLWNQSKVSASYSYTDPKLSEDAPQLSSGGVDALVNARLPGTPEHMLSLRFEYDSMLSSGTQMVYRYSGNYSSDVYTQLKNESGLVVGGGDRLGSQVLHNVSVDLSRDNWDVSFYIDNLTNEYNETNARDEVINDYTVGALNVGFRRHFRYISRPRTIGIGYKFKFK